MKHEQAFLSFFIRCRPLLWALVVQSSCNIGELTSEVLPTSHELKYHPQTGLHGVCSLILPRLWTVSLAALTFRSGSVSPARSPPDSFTWRSL